MISRPCDDCYQTKRCHAYRAQHPALTGPLLYLCRPGARALGYRKERTPQKV